jgi:predicted ribosome quality control (RQC) complex YloA/Tae2 family protein
MVRITSKTPKGDVISVASTRNDLEVPDDTSEALLEPVQNGRPGALAVAQGRIWSPECGIQEIEDRLKKQKLVEEEKVLKAKQEADCKRRAQEADKRVKVVEKVEKKAERAEKTEKQAKKVEKTEKKDEKTSK